MTGLLAATQQANPLVGLLPFLLVGVALYFIMIRPQKKRMQDQRDLISSVEVGDEVLTIGGVFAVVRHVDDEADELTVEVSPGITLRIVKSAIARKVVAEEETEEESPWIDDEGSDESDESEAGGDK